MKIRKGSSLVIESDKQKYINIAHERAKSIFKNVSPIKLSTPNGNMSFIIAPDKDFKLSELVILDDVEKKSFVEWCVRKNEHVQYQVLRAVQIHY